MHQLQEIYLKVKFDHECRAQLVLLLYCNSLTIVPSRVIEEKKEKEKNFLTFYVEKHLFISLFFIV